LTGDELLKGKLDVVLTTARVAVTTPARGGAAAIAICCRIGATVRGTLVTKLFGGCTATEDARIGRPVAAGSSASGCAACISGGRKTNWTGVGFEIDGCVGVGSLVDAAACRAISRVACAFVAATVTALRIGAAAEVVGTFNRARLVSEELDSKEPGSEEYGSDR